MMLLNVTKKTGLHPLSRKHNFEKATGSVNLNHTAILVIKLSFL